MEINCQELLKHKVKIPKEWQNMGFIFWVYMAMAFVMNNKDQFIEETGDPFCDDCWMGFEEVMRQFDQLISHTQTEHIDN